MTPPVRRVRDAKVNRALLERNGAPDESVPWPIQPGAKRSRMLLLLAQPLPVHVQCQRIE